MCGLIRTFFLHLQKIKILPINLVYQGSAQIFSRGSLIFSGMLISNFEGIEVYGHVQYFYLTATTVSTYLGLGLGGVANRFFALELSDASENRRNEMATVLLLSLGIAVVMLVLAVVASDQILGIGYSLLAVVFGSMVCSLFLQSVFEGIFLAKRKFKEVFFINMLGGIVLPVTIYIVVLKNGNQDALIQAFNAVNLFIFTVYFLILFSNEEFRKLVRMRRQFGWLAVKVVLALALPTLLIGIVNSSVPWLIGRFMRQGGFLQEFGVLAIGLQWFSAVLYFPLVLTRVLAPEVMREIDQGRHNHLIFLSRLKSIGLTAVFVAVIVIFFSPVILSFYKTAEIVNILRFCLMALSGIFAACMLPFASYMIVSGFAWKWLLIQFVLAIVTLFVFFGLSSFGFMYPEAAIFVGYLSICIYLLRSKLLFTCKT